MTLVASKRNNGHQGQRSWTAFDISTRLVKTESSIQKVSSSALEWSRESKAGLNTLRRSLLNEL